MDRKTVGDITFTDHPERFDKIIRGVYKCNGKNVYVTSSEGAFNYRHAPSYQIACSRGEDATMDFIDKVFVLMLREDGREPDITDNEN